MCAEDLAVSPSGTRRCWRIVNPGRARTEHAEESMIMQVSGDMSQPQVGKEGPRSGLILTHFRDESQRVFLSDTGCGTQWVLRGMKGCDLIH